METRRIRYWLLLLLCGAGACSPPQARLLLPPDSGAVTLAVDSVQLPELASFPVRLTLTNYTRHPVVLVFASPTPQGQADNFYLVAGSDTFYLGVKSPDHRLVFPGKTATSFVCDGYFLRGKGHFDSFGRIDSAFKEGKVVYELAGLESRDSGFPHTSPPVDTVLLPTKVEALAHAWVGHEFLPGSYRWREQRLVQH
ncbi:hypothetical protein [Hymenobacter siberiensis]|jgi:hypothetical protein|uniref:hypothetical protein n=1 Tax=Hymenobacter siberiensis TaxID=2848396 RepID=UPI001C1E0F7E|nr:hypothetical protein [Hymenobacter siberiensis]MBU6121655.1 hypothetical protein [Hymenobacter siberiensis]